MKFNFTRTSKENDVVKNHEGAKAYTLTPELELYAGVVTASLSNQFYEKAGDRVARIRALVAKNDPEFVAKLAIYTRTQMYMRSVPLVLAVELAKITSGNEVVSKMVNGVVNRADEITELLAYYQLANERTGAKKLNKLSKQLQKGLALAFNRFDAYQFAKYNRDAEVKMRDALFLVHPKAKDEAQQAIFNKIVNDTLETPYTWETELSALGQEKFENEAAKTAAFRAKWEELIDSGKVGYMAMLRNLRNILEANVSAKHIQKVCEYLANEKAVTNSKQFPFRFLAAHRELKSVKSSFTNSVLQALEDAVKISIVNMKGFDYNTRVVIACDVSGSMQRPISEKSKVMSYDIGLMLGMLLQSKCKNVESGMFGDKWKIISLPTKNVLQNVDEFYKREGEVGYSTNGYKVIDDLRARNVVVDKVMMFTDCQMWNSAGGNSHIEKSWNEYKKLSPNATLYLFDLAGYGNTPLNYARPDVALIAGWSDKVFDVLAAIENGQDAVAKIKEIVL